MEFQPFPVVIILDIIKKVKIDIWLCYTFLLWEEDDHCSFLHILSLHIRMIMRLSIIYHIMQKISQSPRILLYPTTAAATITINDNDTNSNDDDTNDNDDNNNNNGNNIFIAILMIIMIW